MGNKKKWTPVKGTILLHNKGKMKILPGDAIPDDVSEEALKTLKAKGEIEPLTKANKKDDTPPDDENPSGGDGGSTDEGNGEGSGSGDEDDSASSTNPLG